VINNAAMASKGERKTLSTEQRYVEIRQKRPYATSNRCRCSERNHELFDGVYEKGLDGDLQLTWFFAVVGGCGMWCVVCVDSTLVEC
jgi:hypothetical protein